jgi:hypothetical protein
MQHANLKKVYIRNNKVKKYVFLIENIIIKKNLKKRKNIELIQ